MLFTLFNKLKIWFAFYPINNISLQPKMNFKNIIFIYPSVTINGKPNKDVFQTTKFTRIHIQLLCNSVYMYTFALYWVNSG